MVAFSWVFMNSSPTTGNCFPCILLEISVIAFRALLNSLEPMNRPLFACCRAFRAASISPGISLRFKALHEFTGALPLVEVSDEVPAFGYDTTTAIRSGVVNGVVEELKGSFAKAKQEYGCKKMVLTGGDAPYLMSQLAMNTTEVVYHPDLVAEGLNRILRYNENN